MPPDDTPPAVIPLGFLLLLGSLAAIGPFSIDMYLPAFPSIQADFVTTPDAVQASLSSYFLGLAAGQLGFGPIIDRVGRRGPLLAGLALYVFASVGCGLAPSIGTLVAFRFLQALGACAGMVVTRALLRDLYSPRDMARFLSLIMLVMGVAPVIAPSIGSFLFRAFGWQALFAVLAVYGSVVMGAVAWSLPETLKVPAPRVGLGALLATYAGLFRNRVFVGYALAGGIAQAGMFAYIASSSFVFLGVYHLEPSEYAILFGVNALGLIGASQVNAVLLRKHAPEAILPWTLGVFCLAGMALVGSAATGFGGMLGIAAPLFVALACLGFCFPNTTAVAMASVSQRAGMASALLGTLQFVFAGVSSYLTGRWYDGTALPMASVILGCGVLASASLAATAALPAPSDEPAPG